jgi:two-component system response regulator AtoC
MHMFMEYAWPGNIRELQNLVRRIVVLGTESPVRKEIGLGFPVAARRTATLSTASPMADVAAVPPAPPHLNGSSHAPVPAASPASVTPVVAPDAVAAVAGVEGNTSLKDVSRIAAREAEKVLILRMLQQTRWNRKETAQMLGISYKALLYKIKDAGLDKAPTP